MTEFGIVMRDARAESALFQLADFGNVLREDHLFLADQLWVAR
jgi:hypothetical protein